MTRPAAEPRRPPKGLLVTAAAGYGRTSALEACSTRVVDAAALLERPELVRGAGPGGSLGVDDVHRLDAPAQHRLAALLSSVATGVRVTVASRAPLPAGLRLLPGPPFERGPRDLRLDLGDVAETLRDEYGVDDPTVASAVLQATAGWAQLVHLAGDLAGRGVPPDELSGALSEPGTASALWLESDVLGDLPDDVRTVLESTARLDRHHPEPWTLLGHPADRANRAYAWLRRVGVLVPGRDRDDVSGLVPVLAVLLRTRAPRPARGVSRRLAGWFDRHDLPLSAARTLAGSGAEAAAARLLERRAERLLRHGHAAGVAEILRHRLEPLHPSAWPAEQRLLLGHAQRLAGDSAAALRTLGPLLADDSGPLTPAVAWRGAMTHYSLGEYVAALALLDRTPETGRPASPDDVEVWVCRSHALARLGRDGAAAATAARAVSAARLLGDDAALAAAHLAAAHTARGDERELHLAQALAAASRCGDQALRARVLLNQADAWLTAARYHDAVTAATGAVEAAEQGSPPGRLVAASSNLGDALRQTGRYAEAELQLARSVALSRRHGLRRTFSGLLGLAELHLARGRWHEAVAGYEQAAAAARVVGEVQVLVVALCALVRALTREAPGPGAPDLATARAALEEAAGATSPEFAAYPAVAAGWLHLAEGRADAAAADAERALRHGRAHGVAAGVADALELRAASTEDAPTARTALEEAEAVWAAGGAEPAADRVRVLLGRLPGADPRTQSDARAAARRLRRLGVSTVAGLPVDRAATGRTVCVRVLDGFEVLVGGAPVPVTAWRSRQARTLVKILAARRGRLLRRTEICDLLWPDDDPSRTGHRLSVLLSAVRGVLDPDRSWPADHFVRGDHGGLALDPRHVEVDADRLLADAAHATDLLRSGSAEPAVELLTELASGRADVLGDEPDATWADPLREEVRAATLGAVRQLAFVRARRGEHDEASVLLVRLLTADPYDEPAHRALVRTLLRAGRHGEARRAFTRWAEAMRAIDAPLPDPAAQLVLTPR